MNGESYDPIPNLYTCVLIRLYHMYTNPTNPTNTVKCSPFNMQVPFQATVSCIQLRPFKSLSYNSLPYIFTTSVPVCVSPFFRARILLIAAHTIAQFIGTDDVIACQSLHSQICKAIINEHSSVHEVIAEKAARHKLGTNT